MRPHTAPSLITYDTHVHRRMQLCRDRGAGEGGSDAYVLSNRRRPPSVRACTCSSRDWLVRRCTRENRDGFACIQSTLCLAEETAWTRLAAGSFFLFIFPFSFFLRFLLFCHRLSLALASFGKSFASFHQLFFVSRLPLYPPPRPTDGRVAYERLSRRHRAHISP